MTRALPVLIALLLLAAGLAGCLGSDDEASAGDAEAEQAGLSSDDAEASPAPGADEGEREGDTGELEPLVFPGEGPVRATEWANNTFTAHENCYVSGCATGDAVRLIELDSGLPAEAPVHVSAELTYDTGPRIFIDPIDLYVWSEDGTFYSFERTEEEGRESADATILGGSQPLVFEVFYQWPTGAEPEVDYQLRIDVESAPTTLPAGVPVAVDAEPGERFLVERAAEGQASGDGASLSLLAYGPDDAFLDRFQADGDSLELRLPDDTSAGEHVLLVPEDGAPARILTNGTQTEMRPLEFTYEWLEGQPVDGTEAVEWSFDVGERPLAVGVTYGTNRPMAVTGSRGMATVAGPGGEVLSEEIGCGVCLGNGLNDVAITSIGQEGLVAGSYDAVYEPDGEAGTEVGGLVVTYER